jgi:hypothetical protein
VDSSSALLQVLHQHLLGRGEGMKRFHQTGEDLLELHGVFARRQHEAQRGLGIEAVLEGVISHTLLPLRAWHRSRAGGRYKPHVASPPGCAAQSISGRSCDSFLSHPRRHFSSFDGHVVSPCQNGKGANGEMVKRRSRFPRFAIFPFPHLFRMTRQNETVETSETSETQNF